MRITLKLLAEELGVYFQNVRLFTVGDRPLKGIRIYGSTPDSIDLDYLYFCSEPKDQYHEECSYLMCGKPTDAPSSSCIIVLDPVDEYLSVYEKTHAIFAAYAEFEQRLMRCVLMEGSITDLLSLSEEFLRSPVIAYDASLGMIGHSPGTYEMLSSLFEGILDVTELEEELIRQMDSIGFLRRLDNTTKAYYYQNCKTPFTACSLIVKDHRAGFLTIPSPTSSPPEAHLVVAETLAFCISNVMLQKLAQHGGLLTASVSHDDDTFDKGSDYFLKLLARSGWKRNDGYLVLAISRRIDDKDIRCFEGLFKQLFDNCQVIMQKDVAAIILCRTSSDDIRRNLERLQHVLNYNELLCGCSLDFTDFTELRSFFYQAKAALSLCRKESADYPVAFYEDCFLEHITLSFSESFNLEQFAPPCVRVLLEYDAINGGELLETLYCYLMYERNYDACTEQLFIHKSTLKYRLNKIKQLAPECINPKNRLSIMLSIYMLKASQDYQNNQMLSL